MKCFMCHKPFDEASEFFEVFYGNERDIVNMCTDCAKDYPKVYEEKEAVNHPSHYNAGKYEAIDVIEDWKLGLNLGNTVKYISRAEHKNNKLEDLKKAQWYLNREIERISKDENN